VPRSPRGEETGSLCSPFPIGEKMQTAWLRRSRR
jgi:hypothetical protein